MTGIDITKTVVNIAVGAGVGKIVHDVIANNTNDPEKAIEKTVLIAGSVVLGMMAKDASKSYASAKIDSYVALWNRLKNRQPKEEPKDEQ